MADVYRCTVCGTASEFVVLGFDIRFAKGRCQKCGKDRDYIRDSVKEGEKRKREGQGSASGHVPTWFERARAWVIALARGTIYTSEDVTAALGQPPSSGAVGALMTAMAKMGYHEKHRLVQAKRPNQHAAEIWEWIRL